jgi:hypothetical protein
MPSRVITRRSWRHVALLLTVLGLALMGGEASANKLGAGPTTRPAQGPRMSGAGNAPNAPLVNDAFMQLVPGTGGSVPAPPNGGSVPVGGRFVLDLMVNAGSHTDVEGQQSYLTFTSSILQNARVDLLPSACMLVQTAQADMTTFDSVLQNEVCNGPGNCVFHGTTVGPGSLAYASGAVTNPNCLSGCGGTFRVARIGLCAVAPGQAVLHWQFSPPAPTDRDTWIADFNNNPVQNQALFTDYVINVLAPTSTPTNTPTSTPTPTNTPTSLLEGHVTWEGRPPQPNPLQQLPITLTLRLTTGGPYYDYTGMTTDASGNFTVPVAGLPGGTYNWRVKNPQYLANSGTLTLSGAPLTQVEMGLMLAGDDNGDNLVSAADFTILKSSFGFGCGDPGYQAMADFTGDCVINAIDFSLLRSNFGLGGSPGIGP